MHARVLIADDSPVVRQHVSQLVRQRPEWEVCGEAVDGADAVQKVRDLSPDLVILDFLMPGLNGLEAAREISRQVPDVPILLCTMYLSPQLVDLARGAGVKGALSKTNLSELTSGLETILRGETFFFSVDR